MPSRFLISIDKKGHAVGLVLGWRVFHLHGLVRKAQEKVRVCAQVARLEVGVLGCDAVDL